MTHELAAVTWELRPMILGPLSTSLNLTLYVLFLLFACIFTSITLIRVWRTVAPFSRRQPEANPAYRGFLQASAASMQHLTNVTYLVMGILASVMVYDISDQLLANAGTNIIMAITFLIRRLSSALTVGLLVSLYALLARWHISRRIENVVSPD